jgi:hypothetical protein
MARHTLDELETILLNLLHQLENFELSDVDWDNLNRLMEHWDELMDLLDRLENFPWEQLPPEVTPPTLNQYTMVRHTRVFKASIEEGGRFEASSYLRGLVVLCIDEEPQSLYYCTGTRWLRVSSGNTLAGSYGYISDDTPLGYTRGDLLEIPVSKLEPVSGDRDDIGMGMQVTDAYHGVGIVILIRTVELYPELAEDMAVIATWIGEPDGTNLYANNEGDPGGVPGGGSSGGGEAAYDYDQVARQLANTALDTANQHIADFNNPHQVTAAQVGLDLVDNTADAQKPVSTAQAAAIQLLREYVDTTIQLLSDVSDQTAEQIFDHLADMNNPHGVTAAQIGVDSVSITELTAFKNRADGFATAAQGTKADNAVLLSGNQSVDGVKTFTETPVIPSALVLPTVPSDRKPATEAQVAAAVRGTDLPGGFASDNTNDTVYEKYYLVARYTSCARQSNSVWYRDLIKLDFSVSARASGLHNDYSALGTLALSGGEAVLNYTKQLYFGDIEPGAGEFVIVQKEKADASGGKRIVYEFYMRKNIIGVDSNVCFLNIGNFLYYSNDGDPMDVSMEIFRSYDSSQGTDSIPVDADETILARTEIN